MTELEKMIDDCKARLDVMDQKVLELVKAMNTNSELLGTLISALGISVRNDDSGKLWMGVSIPTDPKAQHGFISRLVRDVVDLKTPKSPIITLK